MHEVLVNRLGGLSLPRKSVVTCRLTDRPDMTLDVYRGRKTTMHHHAPMEFFFSEIVASVLIHSFLNINRIYPRKGHQPSNVIFKTLFLF